MYLCVRICCHVVKYERLSADSQSTTNYSVPPLDYHLAATHTQTHTRTHTPHTHPHHSTCTLPSSTLHPHISSSPRADSCRPSPPHPRCYRLYLYIHHGSTSREWRNTRYAHVHWTTTFAPMSFLIISACLTRYAHVA